MKPLFSHSSWLISHSFFQTKYKFTFTQHLNESGENSSNKPLAETLVRLGRPVWSQNSQGFFSSKAQHVQVFLPHLSLTTKMLPKDLMNGWLLVCGWIVVIELIESCKNISDSISEWSPQNRPRICACQREDTHHKSASLRTTAKSLSILSVVHFLGRRKNGQWTFRTAKKQDLFSSAIPRTRSPSQLYPKMVANLGRVWTINSSGMGIGSWLLFQVVTFRSGKFLISLIISYINQFVLSRNSLLVILVTLLVHFLNKTLWSLCDILLYWLVNRDPSLVAYYNPHNTSCIIPYIIQRTRSFWLLRWIYRTGSNAQTEVLFNPDRVTYSDL